jgi:hypothetical protein
LDTIQKTSDTKIEREFNEKCVSFYLKVEQNKQSFDETITEEYLEKVTLYGYLIVRNFCSLMIKKFVCAKNMNNNFKLFGSSFNLAPLLILIILLIDLRTDAQRLLWLYRRPIGFKAQDIGLNTLWSKNF